MTAGRPRHPTKILQMRGSKHAKGREHEPQPPQDMPKAPGWLCPAAKTQWRHLSERMALSPGWVTSVDGSVLAQFCQAVADVGRLTKEVRREGEVLSQTNKHGEGYVTRNPKTMLLKEAHALALKAGSELGLSPSSRSKVKAVPTKAKPDDPWGSF